MDLTLDIRTDVNKNQSAAKAEEWLEDKCNSWTLIANLFFINLFNFQVQRSPSVREKASEGIQDNIHRYSKVVSAREIVAQLAATIWHLLKHRMPSFLCGLPVEAIMPNAQDWASGGSESP